MRISAKADYAVRAAVELAAAANDEKPVKAERIAVAQDIPLNFLENILGELRHAGIVRSHRGAEGGFRLAKPADQLTIADVIRAVEGPLASVRGGPPEDATYPGAATALARVWIAVRASLRSVVEHVTLADVAAGKLPRAIDQLAEDPEAWVTR
jgi:Rrf2 family protein